MKMQSLGNVYICICTTKNKPHKKNSIDKSLYSYINFVFAKKCENSKHESPFKEKPKD